MLSSDQKSRLSLLRTLAKCKTKEAKEALMDNYWDTSMALEWMRYRAEHENADLDEFHTLYEKAKDEAAKLPVDRYDVSDSKKTLTANRQHRRAAMKKDKKKKK